MFEVTATLDTHGTKEHLLETIQIVVFDTCNVADLQSTQSSINIATVGGNAIPHSAALVFPGSLNIIEDVTCGDVKVTFLEQDGNELDLQ